MVERLLDWLFPKKAKHPDLIEQEVSQARAIEAQTGPTSTPICPMCGMVNHERPFPVIGSGMCMRNDCPD